MRRAPRRRPASLGLAAGAAAAAFALTLAACGSAGTSRSAGDSRSTGAPVHGTGQVSRSSATSTSGAAAPIRAAAADRTNWPTYDRVGGRSGVSISTPALKTGSSVKHGWTTKLDGDVLGQPLVVGSHILVATENDTVYALGRWTGKVVWSRHLGTPVSSGLACSGDIHPSGITGTPAEDVAAARLYVVTLTATPSIHHTLWTLDSATGKVVRSRPIDGPGSVPSAEQQRGALVIDGSKVYVAYGGIDGDCGPYKGWVVGAPLNGSGGLVHFVTHNQREAGIWAPPGPVVGPGGIYTATGNGTPPNAVDDSDSVLRLSPKTLGVWSRFTPSNYPILSENDTDLGSTSPALLPANNVFMIGKEGVGYVLGADHLGGTGGQLTRTQICSGGFGGDAVDGDLVVLSCFDGLYAVRYTPGHGKVKPKLAVAWSITGIQPGPPIIAGNVVWDATRGNDLIGARLGSGSEVAHFGLNSVGSAFPSLSAAAGRLFVPEGAEVTSYKGI
ncbi:MAG TPA: PQQ-binding-like beta-propeller repeat protein [Acidimicrobiales bacterium]|nr:PQQ-binding-like beta-propeller repeat protein [Acidimicrobiales bacterium]